MRWITLVTSLSIAGVAAWYSIVGLMAIFAGAAIPIAVMGGVLEVGKLVTASWLHNNWKGVEWWLRTYLVTAVVVLMLITSLGIFGFLSKAHLEHSISSGGNNEIEIKSIQRRIDRQNAIIADSSLVLAQLDKTVSTLQDYDRIRGPEGAIAVRKAQQEERDALNETINKAYNTITTLTGQLEPLQRQTLELEVEVGPLKYIAELIYGDEAKNMFDEAVRFVILLLIFVFDPLAIALLLVASRGFRDNKKSKIFYDDGHLKVHPDNVVAVDVEENAEWPTWVEDDIPTDEDVEDYEVVEPEPEVKPKKKHHRKHEDGWYTQGGTPDI